MAVLNILYRYKGYDKKNHDWPQVYVILLASLTGLSSGANTAWPSPSIPILISNSSYIENITLEKASYFPIIGSAATIVASPIVAILMDVVGRKNVITFAAIPHLVSWILISLAKDITVLYISRIFYGISDAILYCVVPLYITEVARPQTRGSWGNLMMSLVFMGQFLINVIGTYCDIATTALVFLIFPTIQLLLMAFAPESPYFLLMKNRNKEAKDSLKQLRWNENIEEEFSNLIKDVNRQVSESGTFRDLFTIHSNRKALLIATAMRFFQQFSGFSTFVIYTQYIFSLVDGGLTASDSAIIFSGLFFFVGSTCSFIIHKFGRRPLMIFSNFGSAIALFIEAIYFCIMNETTFNLSSVSWIPLAGMMWYIFTCTVGLGLLTSIMAGELFSVSIKNKAAGLLSVFFAFCTILVPKLFQFLTENFGMYIPFFIFAICTVCATFFSYFCLPETKGKTLEEVQQMLSNGKISCQTFQNQKQKTTTI